MEVAAHAPPQQRPDGDGVEERPGDVPHPRPGRDAADQPRRQQQPADGHGDGRGPQQRQQRGETHIYQAESPTRFERPAMVRVYKIYVKWLRLVLDRPNPASLIRNSPRMRAPGLVVQQNSLVLVRSDSDMVPTSDYGASVGMLKDRGEVPTYMIEVGSGILAVGHSPAKEARQAWRSQGQFQC